jgi:hypothetical protein
MLFLFASGQTLLKASWTQDLWVTQWPSLRKFSLYSLDKNQDSCFIMQELRLYVTPQRASSSYRFHVHSFIMHAPGWKVGPLRVYNTILWAKNTEDKDCARRNVHFQENFESLVAPSRAEHGVAAILDQFHGLLFFCVKGSRHLVLWSLGNLTGLSEILRQGTGCVKGRY